MTEEDDYLAPEQKARMDIDEQLVASGWVVQDYKHAAIAAAQVLHCNSGNKVLSGFKARKSNTGKRIHL